MTGKKAGLVFTLCLLACFALPGAVERDKPPAFKDSATPVKAVTVAYSKPTLPDKAPTYIDGLPLSRELQDVTRTACEAENVPFSLALAVMEQESQFTVDAVSSSGCYGLLQLNPAYFPSGLTPADNIRAGVGYLGEMMVAYDTTEAAVTAYFYGPSDRVGSWYSEEVMERVEKWESVLGQ